MNNDEPTPKRTEAAVEHRRMLESAIAALRSSHDFMLDALDNLCAPQAQTKKAREVADATYGTMTYMGTVPAVAAVLLAANLVRPQALQFADAAMLDAQLEILTLARKGRITEAAALFQTAVADRPWGPPTTEQGH